MHRYLAYGLLAILAVAVIAGTAPAGTIVLGNSGWAATWASFRDPVLSVNVDFETADSVFIEKKINFLPSDLNPTAFFIDPAVIVFQQISPNAKPFIVVNDEQVINNTGLDWIGFEFTLLGATFDTALTNVNQPGGFSIDPFTTATYLNNNSLLQVGGGVVPSGPAGNNVWFPGAQSGGLYVISAPGGAGTMTAFSFKEQPIIIPLPAAAWTGLGTLAGLFVIRARSSLRRIFA